MQQFFLHRMYYKFFQFFLHHILLLDKNKIPENQNYTTLRKICKNTGFLIFRSYLYFPVYVLTGHNFTSHVYSTLETHVAFLVISVAFEKIWNEGLLFTLKSAGVSATLLKRIDSFLTSISTT